MAVFRGDDKQKPNDQEITPPQETSPPPSGPEPIIQNEEPYYGGGQPGGEVNQERDLLDKHRARSEQDSADYYKPSGKENSPDDHESIASRFVDKKVEEGKSTSKKILGSLGGKAALGLIGLLLPTLIGIVIYMLFLQAGGNLEHISRITNGIRFAGLHGEIRKRTAHINKVHTLETLGDLPGSESISRYKKTSLGKRLITGGWDADKARLTVDRVGIDIKYSRVPAGPGLPGVRRPYSVDYNDGNGHVRIENSRDVDRLNRTLRNRLPSQTFTDWLHTQATVRLISKKLRMPFSRFGTVLRQLRSGDLANNVKGLRTAVTGGLLRSRESRRLGSITSAIQGGELNRQADELTEAIESGEVIDSKEIRSKVRQAHRAKFIDSGLFRAIRALGNWAFVTEIITWGCIFEDLNSQIENAFRLRINNSQDSASSLLTLNSQIKSGEAHPELVADYAKRFEGFEKSASYKALVSDLPFEAEADFSQSFSAVRVFGIPVDEIRRLNRWLGTPARAALGAWNAFQRALAALNPLHDPIIITCADVLHPVTQTALITIELLIGVVAFVKAIITKAVGQVTWQTFKRAGWRAAFKVSVIGGTVALDQYIFNHVVPVMIENISGVDTVPLPSPDDIEFSFENDPTAGLFNDSASAQSNSGELYANKDPEEEAFYQGALNFATIDYGMHYLKEEVGLISGASHRPVGEEVERTVAYMDAYQAQFAQKGLFNNVFSLDNPFSIASTLSIQAPSRVGEARAQAGGLLANIFGGRLFGGLFGKAHAQELSNAELQELLYPGQRWVTGFDESEVEGEGRFGFFENTEWVESRLGGLISRYSVCLQLDAGDFLYSQTYDIGSDEANRLYPPKCYEDEEAKRFKMYFQDCILVESVAASGTGQSPFFSTACDPLLGNAGFLREPIRYED